MVSSTEKKRLRILVLHGPNLNMLGKREPAIYGTQTLSDINTALQERACQLDCELAIYQSNSEGTLIDYLQEHAETVDGIIINPGALTHYGLSLRDALAGVEVPFIEVHLSNIHAREPWRRRSVTAPLARGQVCGLGWRGYMVALAALVEILKDDGEQASTAPSKNS